MRSQPGVSRVLGRVTLAERSCIMPFDERAGEIVNFVVRKSGIEFVARAGTFRAPYFVSCWPG